MAITLETLQEEKALLQKDFDEQKRNITKVEMDLVQMKANLNALNTIAQNAITPEDRLAATHVAQDIQMDRISQQNLGPAYGDRSIAQQAELEKGFDVEDIIGTGKDGRITKSDVINTMSSSHSGFEPEGRKTSREKMSMLRRKIAQRLVAVKNWMF